MANVMVEYDYADSENPDLNDLLDIDNDTQSGRRVRRPEAILQEAAEYVTRGETFQKVANIFNIPISTIRFYMARKGILPRRKRGRTTAANGNTISSTTSFLDPGSSFQSEMFSLSPLHNLVGSASTSKSRSSSPTDYQSYPDFPNRLDLRQNR